MAPRLLNQTAVHGVAGAGERLVAALAEDLAPRVEVERRRGVVALVAAETVAGQ
jgi:hypothetical protein